MYHTTGFTRRGIVRLCEVLVDQAGGEHGWPPILGLHRSVVVVLTYLRRNHTQVELAEAHGVSQPTVSRAVKVMTALIARALGPDVPTGDDLVQGTQYIVDGTLLPCWSWKEHPGLYSGKHHRTGVNVQVACTLDGRLAWVSDPVEGCRHDAAAIELSGVLDLGPENFIGDKGFIGRGMITPFRRPPGGELLDWQKDFNTAINKIRYVIERCIANLKTWRILHTDYRRPYGTFNETITAVLGLIFAKLA